MLIIHNHAQISETCQLAVERINWLDRSKEQEEHKLSKNPYASVDPAPPTTGDDSTSLEKTLLDESESLFQRYEQITMYKTIYSIMFSTTMF